MPGPVLTVTISESVRRGFWAGPLIILGHGILEVVLLALIVLGLAEFIARPQVVGVIGILGGVILFWFSMLMLKDIRHLKMDLKDTEDRKGNPIAAGILTSLANPYWTIWWATIGLGYVVISLKFGFFGVALFFIGHILADLVWYSFIAFMIARGRRFMTDRMYRGLVGACAVLLIVFGAYFGVSGVYRFL